MGCIYKHTNNITQEAYIGYTARDADERKKEHISGNGNQPLKDAIDEYGEENFTFNEILEDGIPLELLPEREKYWIAKLDTFHNGYNLTSGGGSGKEVSEETREKISEANKGRNFSVEHCQKISEALKGRKHTTEHRRNFAEARKNSSETARRNMSKAQRGKKHSAETRRKMSEAQKGEKGHNFGKTMSLEQRRKISETKRARYKGKESHHFYGRTHTAETRRKISEARMGKKLPNSTRKKMSEAQKGNQCRKGVFCTHYEPAKTLFFSLSPDMDLSEKGKILRNKFTGLVHRSTIRRWIIKWSA